ncbi:MAG: alkaline phosphatase PhoX [Patiriisocius sp.]|uniref:alkaline phosphatase PhoX n=1 Tax=Patiriisocius sp. TaxID=2822396 RepID=UPI003EF2F151
MKKERLLVGFLCMLSVLFTVSATASETTNTTTMAGPYPFAAGSNWSYNDTGVDLGTSWSTINYDDSAWQTGNGKFGYGDGNETTTLNFGPNQNNKYPTYYFRYEFEVTNTAQYGDLLYNILFDDGVVVYLNGTEIHRANMPAGTINYNTYASGTIGGGDENDFDLFTTSNLLVNGTNVIAVELHQATPGSSDLGFDFFTDFVPVTLDPAPYPVAPLSAWRYLDTGVSLDAAPWTEGTYDVSTWAIGVGNFGYGDPVTTEISFGPDPANKYITTYFSKEIEVDLAMMADMVEFGLVRDDGAIVYVNGVEVFRDNMPAGAFDYLTGAESTVGGADESTYFVTQVPKTAFVNGINRISVELHNRDAQSSDLKFDMYMQNAEIPVDPFTCVDGEIGCFTSIDPTGQTENMIIASEHKFQLIFKQGDEYTIGGGTVPGNNDFTGFIPIAGSSTEGYVSVNHETTPGGVSIVDVHYDEATQLWVVDQSQPVDLYNTALVTTTRNCSGGVTPWGTVITAEESTNGGDQNNDGYQDVGWLVEIDPETARVINYGNGQEKLWAMGRMNHENVVVSDDMVTAYYGEDGGTDCVYKFVADAPGNLSSGTLYVLKLDTPLVNNDPSSPSAQWIQVPNTTKAERNNVRAAAAALGGTDFNGVEDCEINPVTGEIYFTSKGKGRTYKFTDNGTSISNFRTFVGGMDYEITTENGTFTESWGGGNDNLTFDDKGNLWVLQDGGNNYIWVVRPDHTQANPKVELFASMPNGSEPTGLTFTPDFKFGFFSVQHPSGSNTPQQDATFNDVTFNASATVVFAIKENLGAQVPVADFEASITNTAPGTAVTFTDLSQNTPATWAWTFEGGIPATSTEQSPTVAYLDEGAFNVSLVVSNIAGESQMELKDDYILVQLLGIDEVLKNNVTVYPNPTSGIVNIDLNELGDEGVTITVFDMLGRHLMTTNEVQTSGNKATATMDLSAYMSANQVLMLKVQVGQSTATYKLLTKN